AIAATSRCSRPAPRPESSSRNAPSAPRNASGCAPSGRASRLTGRSRVATWLISVPFASPYAPAIISRLATSDARRRTTRSSAITASAPYTTREPRIRSAAYSAGCCQTTSSENATSSAAKLSRVVHGAAPQFTASRMAAPVGVRRACLENPPLRRTIAAVACFSSGGASPHETDALPLCPDDAPDDRGGHSPAGGDSPRFYQRNGARRGAHRHGDRSRVAAGRAPAGAAVRQGARV